MRTAEPSSSPTDAAADRFLVECEVLRLSTRPLGPILAVQFLLNAGVAVIFGWLYSPVRAALWLTGIAAVTVMRGYFPQRVPETLTPDTLRRAQRIHTLRTGVWEAAHGLAGVLLFNAADPMQQLLLGLIVMGMTLSSAFSVSFHTPAVRLAITLLMAPVIAMGLAFGAPPMVAVALLGVLLLALMLKQVGSHNRQLEENIGLRLNAHALREQALAGLRDSQQAQAERLRFFSAANHDLRQPVMAIGLQTAVLREQLDQGAPTAAVQGTVAALADAQAALETLTHQLLEIGRIEAGVEALVRAAVPLAPLLAEVARQAGGTRIHVRCPADATAWSDAVALRRILANLVDNAVKFAPRGRILLAARRRAGAWRVEVRDGGIGIAPEAQARVFGDFEQVGNAERNLQRGHGLGLGVVRRLADRLHLVITLRSAAGRGAVFGFTVPAAPADAPVADRPALRQSPTVAATPPQALRPGIEVLVVEDNAVVAASLVALLRQWSAQPQVYASAAEALALADLRRIQVALCDIRLPGELDGVALAERLQAHRPGLVIALVSADIDEATQSHALARGWHALRKPVQPAALRAVLARAG
ncbi:hybrid sensor histidine kinase/response regulator [Xenophilus aerolatus]|nr:hybrid sensor histidine kinase/response regulator [Xenophilus aerolatus]